MSVTERELYESFKDYKINLVGYRPTGQIDPKTQEEIYDLLSCQADADSQQTLERALDRFVNKESVSYFSEDKILKQKIKHTKNEMQEVLTEKLSKGSTNRRMRITEEYDNGWTFQWTVPTIICRLKCPDLKSPSYAWNKLKRLCDNSGFCWLTPITVSESGTPIKFAVSSTFEVLLEFSRHWTVLDVQLNVPTRVSACQGSSDNDLMKRPKCRIQLSTKDEKIGYYDNKQIKEHRPDRIYVENIQEDQIIQSKKDMDKKRSEIRSYVIEQSLDHE